MSQTIEGVVQGGVVVPIVPLPEGIRVAIVLPDQSAQANGGAAAAPSDDPLLDAKAIEFLKRHDAEADYHALCSLLRECFPEMLKLEAELGDDYDEPGRQMIVLTASVPQSVAGDVFDAQRRRYYDRFSEVIPLAKHPLFVKLEHFV
jgi:hypothetical protein